MALFNIQRPTPFPFGEKPEVSEAVQAALVYSDSGVAVRPMRLVYGGKVIDMSRIGAPDRIAAMIEMEMTENPAHERFCLVLAKQQTQL